MAAKVKKVMSTAWAEAPMSGFVVGTGQVSAVLGDVKANLEHCIATLDRAAAGNVRLLVLPECYLTGYMFEDEKAARASALRLDGPELASIVDACGRLGLFCVVGFVELGDEGIFNAAALIGADGVEGHYRKAHLPWLGVDRFVRRGNLAHLPVFDTPLGRVGIAICYDARFPEFIRALALNHADLIAMPTCWPESSSILPDHYLRVRASENRVFVVAADRGDDEGGVTFLGRSQIVHPSGTVIAEAARGDALLSATIDIREARNKRIVFRPGVFELALFDDRRPDLYEPLTNEYAWLGGESSTE